MHEKMLPCLPTVPGVVTRQEKWSITLICVLTSMVVTIISYGIVWYGTIPFLLHACFRHEISCMLGVQPLYYYVPCCSSCPSFRPARLSACQCSVHGRPFQKDLFTVKREALIDRCCDSAVLHLSNNLPTYPRYWYHTSPNALLTCPTWSCACLVPLLSVPTNARASTALST